MLPMYMGAEQAADARAGLGAEDAAALMPLLAAMAPGSAEPFRATWPAAALLENAAAACARAPWVLLRAARPIRARLGVIMAVSAGRWWRGADAGSLSRGHDKLATLQAGSFQGGHTLLLNWLPCFCP